MSNTCSTPAREPERAAHLAVELDAAVLAISPRCAVSRELPEVDGEFLPDDVEHQDDDGPEWGA
jgi:hypothetical protein